MWLKYIFFLTDYFLHRLFAPNYLVLRFPLPIFFISDRHYSSLLEAVELYPSPIIFFKAASRPHFFRSIRRADYYKVPPPHGFYFKLPNTHLTSAEYSTNLSDTSISQHIYPRSGSTIIRPT